jgi:hypothetical protein
MSFARWLRATSEQQLMVAAERRMAERHALPPPSPPKGVDLFWQRVYVPAYNLLPWRVRTVVMRAMPGSHRKTWHASEQAQGPAV